MGRPLGSKNKPKDGQMPETPGSEQAKSVGGFTSLDAVAQAAPASTMTEVTAAPPDNKKAPARPRKQPVEVDPLMSDPRYKQAIANMTAGTAEKLIGAPFELWAWAAKDPALRLTEAEQKEWADWMYVTTKKCNLDPTSPRFLIGYAILMLGKQSLTRVVAQFKAKGLELPPEVEKVFNDVADAPLPVPAPVPQVIDEPVPISAEEVMPE